MNLCLNSAGLCWETVGNCPGQRERKKRVKVPMLTLSLSFSKIIPCNGALFGAIPLTQPPYSHNLCHKDFTGELIGQGQEEAG